jgi:hypothetical protein
MKLQLNKVYRNSGPECIQEYLIMMLAAKEINGTQNANMYFAHGGK